MTNEERRRNIDSVRALPSRLEEVLKGLNDSQLDTPYRDGGWTVRQVVHHLADAHLNAFVRMKLMLTEDHPAIKPYRQDAWAAMSDSVEMPVGVSLEGQLNVYAGHGEKHVEHIAQLRRAKGW